MTALPAGWTTTTLGDLALEVRNGISTKPSLDSGLPILRISAVRPMRLDASDVRYLPADFQDAGIYALRTDDLLFTRYNGNRELVGSCARVGAVSGTLTYPDKLIRVRLDTRMALPAFVEAAACAQRARDFIDQQLKTSAGQVGVSGADLKRMPLPVAPLAEQQRIADKLDAVVARVDACRDRLACVTPLLKRFRQSVLVAATGGRLTQDWPAPPGASEECSQVTLVQVASDFSYGSAAKSSRSGRVPVLRMGNIQGGELDWSDLVFTSDDAEIKKYALQPGDVLFNRTNSPELVGKTAVYKGEQQAIYAGYLIRVRCTPRLLPEYLNYCLGSPAGRHYCWSVKSDGVSQSNINASKLRAFAFLLPSAAEQAEIVRRVDTLFAFADRLEARLAKAQAAAYRLTPSLLAKAFRGELVPQDPADEPAAVLLQRLAASRPAPAAKTRRPRAGQAS